MENITHRGFNEKLGWVYGGVFYEENRVSIITGRKVGLEVDTYSGVVVDKKSVGRSVGFKDKLGKTIFEWDIYRHTEEYNWGDEVTYYVCVWLEEISVFTWLSVGDLDKYENERDFLDDCGVPFNLSKEDCDCIQVIGNVYSNPKYLKEF